MSDTTQLERHEPGLRVFAEWTRSDEGPQRLVIEAPKVTRDTLRRAARHLGDMSNEFAGTLAVGARQVMVMRYTEDQFASLPSGGNAYHRGLLDIRDDLAARGIEDPEKLMALAMRVPLETLQACLEIARKRLQ
ncbi:hypothetical protein JIG36_36740 [Actinoplanes sp. LDG1-06]|uniref:Uncharacterized protein n=1 Tax=Paractinoplanes ovalisporus TaxID=2810368 RepID=A0ABS2AMQ9_9ACTN|nr:hypothetical protein [Actinoplanes ovalisporus]MBM2621063.1 hypothetical protein [Actinoplanes ovalisporus]